MVWYNGTDTQMSKIQGNYGGTLTWTNKAGKIDSASVNIGSKLTLNNSIAVSSSVTAPRMRYSLNGESTIVDGTYNSSTDTWTFAFKDINPSNMNDTITMELLNGDSVLETKTYSIKEYFDALYAMTAGELGMSSNKCNKLKTFLADMLEYGAMAQIYTGHDTENLANTSSWVADEKTEEFTAPTSDKATTVHTSSKNDKIKTAFVRLNDCVEIIFLVNATESTTIEVTNESKTQVYQISELTKIDGLYQISTGKLNAHELDKVYTISLKKGDTVLHEITYSVNSYISSMYNNSNESLANLVKALYNYGESAIAYINEE